MSGKSSAVARQAVLTVLLMALGFLVIVQVRASRGLSAQEEVPTRNVYALATMLREERTARQSLEAQVDDLTRRLTVFERATAERRSTTEAMMRDLESLRVAAGLVPLAGPGVTVAVGAAQAPVVGHAPPVVQYVDLVSIINELWAGGAEAVAVSGVRVTATSGFSEVGGTILADRQRLAPPYTIDAIGEPATLAGALQIRGGIIEGLRTLGLTIKITPKATVTVPAIQAVPTLRVAHPAVP
ncbi:MAG TPA: DUF881 domain-containing protein [bacterium]|nr:DUF881 domain-containing protein [bacterium]